MKSVPQITFHQINHSDELQDLILEKIAGLDEIYDKISSLRVWIEPDSRKHRQGTPYRIRLKMAIPRGEVMVNLCSEGAGDRESIRVAIRDVFVIARRKLESRIRTQFSAKHRHHMSLRRPQAA